MSESTWAVPESRTFTFDEPVTKVQVRVVNGTVNVVGTEESSSRLEISSVDGPPLIVTRNGSTLTVAYEDLAWRGFLKWLDRKGWNRKAVVSLAVPAGADVEVGTVGAGAVVSGIRGRTEVRGVSGDATLLKLSGPVRAETVTGHVEAQAVTGDVHFKSVSGHLTVVEGAGATVTAESVSGDMLLDLDPGAKATDVRLTTVSGEVAIRLPHPADARVEATSASGAVSSAFEDLRVGGQWGTKSITGTLGAGNGTLRATTVSGSITLLRRPADEEAPFEDTPPDGWVPGGSAPGASSPGGPPSPANDQPGSASSAGSAGSTDSTGSTGSTGSTKKVL
ncbi:DUF4097 domain-containing protein [Streptomyces sp. NPDC048416]|uniref:DUF4097 family beta strand repeat-containing protein n=1 Tax=Streptomyces sp. NPDC048416 TaxID=3365546 RepID=UPI003713916F